MDFSSLLGPGPCQIECSSCGNFRHWANNVIQVALVFLSNQATYGAPHLVDSKLKKALPGLVSKVYALSLNDAWQGILSSIICLITNS